MDMYKRDRFELLSAYLDVEVTASQRRQIEHWLTTAPEVQCLYTRVLKLCQKWRTMPVPPVQQLVK
jgi:anti-sigma factor RsiW